jgi:hypothetical protein
LHRFELSLEPAQRHTIELVPAEKRKRHRQAWLNGQ